jgi:uncharacterized membrane protein YebE (DUF533 family)
MTGLVLVLVALRLLTAAGILVSAARGYPLARRAFKQVLLAYYAAAHAPGTIAAPPRGAVQLAVEGVENERDRCVAFALLLVLSVNALASALGNGPNGWAVAGNAIALGAHVFLGLISERSRRSRRQFLEQ